MIAVEFVSEQIRCVNFRVSREAVACVCGISVREGRGNHVSVAVNRNRERVLRRSSRAVHVGVHTNFFCRFFDDLSVAKHVLCHGLLVCVRLAAGKLKYVCRQVPTGQYFGEAADILVHTFEFFRGSVVLEIVISVFVDLVVSRVLEPVRRGIVGIVFVFARSRQQNLVLRDFACKTYRSAVAACGEFGRSCRACGRYACGVIVFIDGRRSRCDFGRFERITRCRLHLCKSGYERVVLHVVFIRCGVGNNGFADIFEGKFNRRVRSVLVCTRFFCGLCQNLGDLTVFHLEIQVFESVFEHRGEAIREIRHKIVVVLVVNVFSAFGIDDFPYILEHVFFGSVNEFLFNVFSELTDMVPVMLVFPNIRETHTVRLHLRCNLVVFVDVDSLCRVTDSAVRVLVVCGFACFVTVGDDSRLFVAYRRCKPFAIPLTFGHHNFGLIFAVCGRAVCSVVKHVGYHAVDGYALVAERFDKFGGKDVAVLALDLTFDGGRFDIVGSRFGYGFKILEGCRNDESAVVCGFADNRDFVARDCCKGFVAYRQNNGTLVCR